MKPETTAIVLIEYQNDFTTPGAFSMTASRA
jgi:hypothetical protein